MKILFTLTIICCLQWGLHAQKKPAEKTPTKKEMAEAMKQAEGMWKEMMKDMDPEDKKYMDSMGIKMPNFEKAAKNIPDASNKDMKEAMERENRIVFPKNPTKIAAIPPSLIPTAIEPFVKNVNQKTSPLLKPKALTMADDIFEWMKNNSHSPTDMGNGAILLWAMGKTQIAFALLGKICAAYPNDTDNLSNYASMLSMLGAPELALPILDYLNKKFPKNSTLLNNIGQAWFGLGELQKAQKYLDSAIQIHPLHTQANQTKSLLKENEGKKTEAIEALKNSIEQAYTDEKKEKLSKLGYTLTLLNLKIPKNTKPDPMNLGSFQTPPFPKSVMECATVEPQWKEFRAAINSELDRLKEEQTQAEVLMAKSMNQRAMNAVQIVNAAMENPNINTNNLMDMPIYAARAGKHLTVVAEDHGRKTAELSQKMKLYLETEGKDLTDKYNAEMAAIAEEEAKQTGEGKANADFCPKYRDATDKYLKVYNAKKEEFFLEFLKIEKEYINNSGYYALYSMWPENFEQYKIVLKRQWLEALKASGVFNFASETEFVCQEPEYKKLGPLQKFDDINCQYKSTYETSAGKLEMNCSRWTTTLSVGIVKLQLKQDMDKDNFGDQFESCTILIGPDISRKVELGPIELSVKGSLGGGVEIDRNGVKDFIVTGSASTSASIGNPLSVKAGFEGTMSLVSGSGSVKAKGLFENIK